MMGLLVLFALPQAQSNNLCKDVLKDSNFVEDSLQPLPSKPFLTQLFETQLDWYHNPEYTKFLKLSNSKKLKQIKKNLKLLGVEYSNDFLFSLSIYNIDEFIVIKPKLNSSELNKIAYHLKQKLGVSLVYNPHELPEGTTAYYIHNKNEIGLPHVVVLTGKSSLDLFHEIRHASLTSNAKKGKPSLYEGEVLAPYEKLDSEHLYDQYLSFQEISTFYQDAKLNFKAVTQPSFKKLDPERSQLMMEEAKEQIRISKTVIDFAFKRIIQTIEVLRDKKTKFYVDVLSNNILKVSILNPKFQYEFIIPSETSNIEGNELEVLILHLHKMQIDINTKRDRLDDMDFALQNLM
jgi:hypothetical protein